MPRRSFAHALALAGLLGALGAACGSAPQAAEAGASVPAAQSDDAPAAVQASDTPAVQAKAPSPAVMPAAQAAPASSDGAGPTSASTWPADAPALLEVPWPVDAPDLLKGLVAGSWPPTGEAGFDEPWIDETGVRVAYTGRRAGRRKWSGLRGTLAVLPVNDSMKDRTGPAVAYAFTLVQRNRPEPFEPGAFPDEPVVLHLRYQGRLRLWKDGELIADLQAPANGGVAEAKVPLVLTDAFDVLLFKLGRGSRELGTSFDLQARLSTPWGDAVQFQDWNTMRPSHLPPEVDAELLR